MSLQSSVQLVQAPEWLAKAREKAWTNFESMPLASPTDSPIQKHMTPLNLNFEEFSPKETKISFSGDSAVAMPIEQSLDSLEPYLFSAFGVSDKISALQAAVWQSGYSVNVPDSAECELEITLKAQGNSFNRNVVVVGKNSTLRLFEDLSSSAPGFHSDVVEVFLKEGASLEFASISDYPLESKSFSQKVAKCGKDSQLKWFVGSFGSALSMLTVDSLLEGQGAEVLNNGLFICNGSQHIDYSANATHLVPNTTNHILTKGLLTDKAKAVYRGLITINRPALNTVSDLTGLTLVLGNDAVSNSIPALDIKTNEVKVKHAAASHRIDEEELFYLETRGLSRKDSENLIIDGFLNETVGKSFVFDKFEEYVKWRT